MKLAIIPARGGSKRIPRKNIRDFCGKPILAYSIEAALKAECFDEVMVSTDDLEIAQIAKHYGASVPFMRSMQAASDYAATKDVIIEVINAYAKQNKAPDYFCCIYPTAPFVTATILNEALQILLAQDCDGVMPIVRFSYPIQRALRFQNDHVALFYPEYLTARSQDLEPAYHDAGQFYWYRTCNFVEQEGDSWGRIRGILLSELQVQDIDNINDWALAEIKYRLLQSEK